MGTAHKRHRPLLGRITITNAHVPQVIQLVDLVFTINRQPGFLYYVSHNLPPFIRGTSLSVKRIITSLSRGVKGVCQAWPWVVIWLIERVLLG